MDIRMYCNALCHLHDFHLFFTPIWLWIVSFVIDLHVLNKQKERPTIKKRPQRHSKKYSPNDTKLKKKINFKTKERIKRRKTLTITIMVKYVNMVRWTMRHLTNYFCFFRYDYEAQKSSTIKDRLLVIQFFDFRHWQYAMVWLCLEHLTKWRKKSKKKQKIEQQQNWKSWKKSSVFCVLFIRVSFRS